MTTKMTILDKLSEDVKRGRLAHQFLISQRKNYVFCPIGKVANSSIKAFLYQAELFSSKMGRFAGAVDKKSIHDPVFGPLLRPYQFTPKRMEEILTSENFFKFVFVREPMSRLQSCYNDRVMNTNSVPYKFLQESLALEDGRVPSFEEFVDFISTQETIDMNDHWAPQTAVSGFGHINYHKVYKFENFAEEISNLMNHLYPKVASKIDFKANFSPIKTGDISKRMEISEETKEKIKAIYADDYEAFGYE